MKQKEGEEVGVEGEVGGHCEGGGHGERGGDRGGAGW